MIWKKAPAFFAAALIAAGVSAGTGTAQEVIKFHHDLPANSAQHEGAERFKELVEERSEGRYVIELYPNNALGDDVEVAQQMQFGAVHVAPIPTAKLSNFNPSLQLIDLPFLFPGRDVAYRFLDGEVGMQVLGGLREAGFEPVMVWESGFKQLTCNDQVTEPSDLEGRKVRVMESPLLIAQFRTLGATPIPVAFSETYSALQQGVVECQENPIVSILNMKFYEVQDYLMLSNHGYLGTALIFSKMWFDALPKADQEMLVQAAREAGQFQRERSQVAEAEYLAEIRDAGTTEIVELTDDQIAEFQKAVRPVHEQFADRIGPDLLQATYGEIERLSK